MTETTMRSATSSPLVRHRRSVVAVCCLASCARQMEPPLWVFQPPATSAFNLGWVQVNLFMSLVALTTLGFVLLGGVLGDIFGRRRVMLIGLGGLVVGNLLLFLSPDLPWFLVTRFIAGAFGALVLPLSLALLTLAFADDARARALVIAVYIVITTSAFFLSMLLGQVMYTLWDFRAVFVLPTLLALVAIPLVQRRLTESRMEDWRRFDAVGHAAWALTLLSVAYGLSLWRVAGPYLPLVLIASLTGCAIGLALLIWWDRRTPGSIFEQSTIPRGLLAVLIIYGVAMQFGNVGYLTQVRSALIAGYGYNLVVGTAALTPVLIGMMAMVVIGTRRLLGLRIRPTLAIGLAVAGGLCALTSLTSAARFYPWLTVLMLAFGAAMIVCNTAWTFIFLRSIAEAMIGVRTGISSAIYQLGGAAGGAVASALLATIGLAEGARQLQAQGVPRTQWDEALAALNALLDPNTPDPAALDAAVATQLVAGYELIYIASYERVLLLIAAVCFIGAAVAWFALRDRAAAELTIVPD